jgi:hypothetical protein
MSGASVEAMCKARAENLYPVDPLREAFLASGLTFSHIARQCGWVRYQRGLEIGDATRVARLLGLRDYKPGPGYPRRVRERISYENATRLAEAIGVDPYEVGL